MTANLSKRLKSHKESFKSVEVIQTFEVPTRREAEGVEVQLQQLQKSGVDIEDYFCVEFFNLHSLWFCRDHKGYPKHLTQKPRLTF